MKKFAFALITIFSLFVISCEIGLGASVDTDAPSLEILNPPVDSVIRDTFALTGTWADDGNIADVTVTLRRTDINGESQNIKGTLAGDIRLGGSGTWSAEIVPVAEDGTKQIPDGSYQATVTIKDTVGRTTIRNTTFTIDNTPPVIVLTRPSTAVDSLSSDTYGQTFNLEGQAADTNNVSLIEVMIYSDPECTNHIHTVPLKNVPNSINMDVAKFVKGDTENDYFKIYGESTTEGGPKQFYCKLVAYDGAQRFPADGSAQTEADQKGNGIDTYYLYKDIATTILQNYKITEVYSMLSGAYTPTGTARTVTVEDVMTLLNKSKKSQGKFTLNPKNNPTFIITGRSPLLLDGNDFKNGQNDISNGGQIVIEVSPGLDGIPLDENSLKVYAQKCNDYGVVAANTEKIYPTTTKSESGTSYRFATTLLKNDGFEIGCNYIFGVEGYDTSDSKNAIEPSGKAYGIRLASSGNAPKLEVTTPASGEDVYKSQGQSQVFSGTITVESGAPVLNVYKGNDTTPIITKVYSLTDGTNTGSSIVYSFNETISDFGSTSGKVVFKFVATHEGVDSPAVERTVIYDIIAPEISITEPSCASKYDDAGILDTSAKYVNGTIVFDATIKDKGGANLASAKYEIIADNEVVKTEEINLDNDISISVNTKDTAINGKSFIFRITAKDNAGNTGTSVDSTYTYKADQSTDIPYFVKHTLTTEENASGKRDFDFALTSITTYEGRDKTDKNGTVTKGDYFKFNCYDDDGTVQITIKNKKISNDSQWESDINNLTIVYNKSKDTKALTAFDDYQFPNTDDECGYYEYVVVLSDGNETKQIGPFLVNVAKEKASIKVEATPEYAKNGNSFTANISITPSMGEYSIIRKIGEGIDTPLIDTNNLSYTDTIAVTDLPVDETAVTYYVVDGNNQKSSEYKVTLKKDNDAPNTLSITAPADGKTGKSAISDDEYAFRGEARDAKSGVKYIYYFFGSESTAPTALSSYTREDASNGNYIITKTIESGSTAAAGKLHEGNWYLHIKAEDVAGNVSSVISRQFDIDKAAPELTESGEDDLGYKNAAFTLSGTIVETNGLAATDGLVIQDDKDSSKKWVVMPTGNNWSKEISGLSEGKHTLSITAKDKAGKTTVLKRIVTMDTVKPVVSDTMTLPTGYSFAASSISFSGTVTDGLPSSGLSKVEYYFADGTEPNSKKSETFTAEGQAYWSANIPVSELANMNGVFTAQGTKYITVTAYDNAGNASDSVTKEFVYDTANPELSNIKIKFTGETSANTLGTETKYTKINGYTISGSFNDTGSNVTIGVTSNGTNVSPITQTQNAKSGTWSFTTSSLADGTYSYIITATDASGRTDTANAYIVVDKTNPTLVITETADVYKNSGAHTFNGTITEVNQDTVYAYLYKKNETNPVKQEQIYPVNNAWSWTVVGLDDAEYTLKIEATDKAGNTGSKTSAKKLIIDTVKPQLSITATNLKDTNGNDVSSTLTSKGTYYTKTAFTLNGTITEDYLKTATIKVGNGTASNLTVTDGSWSYNQTATNGVYDYKITATDEAGNSQDITFTVTIDNAAPTTLAIEAPVSGKTGNNALSDNTYIFKGNAQDNTGGTGVAKILYKFVDATATGASTAPADGYDSIDASDGSWTITKTIDTGATASAGNLCEGKYYLYVKAQDKAGNTTSAQSVRFDIDKKDPEISLTSSVKEIYKETDLTANKGSFVISGSASDTYGLDATHPVTITAATKNGSTDYYPAVTSGTYTITFNFGSGNSAATNYLEDNDYTFTIKATDLVGKESTNTTVTKKVSIDTVAPGLSNILVNNAVSDSNKWYNTTDMKISGSVSDNVGVSEVVYKTSTDGTIWSTTEEPFIGTSTWKGTVSEVVSDSTRIKIIARDNVGNETSENIGPWKIDINPPSLTSVKEGTKTLSEDEAYYSNGQNDITLTITATDGVNESGVDRVYVRPYTKLTAETVIDNTYKAVKQVDDSYEITISKTALTRSGTIYARIYDAAGNYTDENLFAITLDSTKPVLQNYTLTQVAGQTSASAYKKDAATYYVNPDSKTFTLSGIATDNLAIGNVNLTMKIGDIEKYNEDFSDGEWLFSGIDMSSWGDDGTIVTATITVTDKAQNTQDTEKSVVSSFNIIFDKASPTSEHKIDAKGKDLVFRVREFDNDTISSETESDDYAGKYNLTWDSATVGGKSYSDIDTNSGAKYGAGTFGNATTIFVRGVFNDTNGSGIKRIYYKLYDRSSSLLFDSATNAEKYNLNETARNTLTNDVVSANNYFTPLTNTEYKRVFYNVLGSGNATPVNTDSVIGGTLLKKNNIPVSEIEDGKTYYKYWTIIPTTYSFTIPNLKEGSNYLVLVAEDNAGNQYLDTVTVKFDHDGDSSTPDINAAFSNFSMNLDTKAPVVQLKSGEQELQYSNKTSPCVIKVTASDPDKNGIANTSSGVKSIVLSMDDIEDTVTCTKNGNYYQGDIKDILPVNGTKSVYATVTDVAGNSFKRVVSSVMVDTAGPVVVVKSPLTDAIKGISFDLSGTVNDANGAGVSSEKGLTLFYTTKASPAKPDEEPTETDATKASTDWVKYTETPELDDKDGWTCSFTASNTLTPIDQTTNVYFVIGAYDTAGSGNWDCSDVHTIAVDRVKPLVNNDVFKVGDITSQASVSTHWFKAQSLVVTGKYTDTNGSGVNKVYYQIKKDGNGETYQGNEYSLVTKVTDGFTYSASISGFADGVNKLKVWATDEAGNKSEETEYIIKIDTKAPAIDYLTQDKYSNRKADLEIEFTLTDEINSPGTNPSGINQEENSTAVKLTVNNKEETAKYDSDKWKVKILKADLPTDTNSYPINVTAIDIAGNKDTKKIGNLIMDIDPPTVTIAEIKDADDTTDDIDVNGEITISGTAGDNLALKTLSVAYKLSTAEDKDENWTKKITTPSNTWNFPLDTSTLEDGKDYIIRAKAEDEAGNTKVQEVTIHVNKDSDRPVVILSNFIIKDGTNLMTSFAPVWFNSSTLYGTVSDDDGAVKSVQAIEKDMNDTTAPSDEEWAAAPPLYRNGNWTFTFSDNGSKKLYFRVVDANNKPFISNAASTIFATYGPKIEDSNGDRTGCQAIAATDTTAAVPATPDDIIYTKIDTNNPNLVHLYYCTSETVLADPSAIDADDWTKVTTDYISEKFGGTNRYLYIKYKAFDTNGIYSITPTFAGNSIAGTATNITATAEASQYKEFISYFDISGVASGSKKRLALNIKDNAAYKMETNGTDVYYEADVDNDAPNVTFTSYVSGSQVFGSSPVSLRGSTTDTSTVTKIEYALSDTNANPIPGWKEITDTTKDNYTNTIAWSISFDGKTTVSDTNNYHAPLLKDSVFEYYGNSVTTAKKIYVWLRVTDELGNVMTNGDSEDSVYYLNVIPTGDIPSVEITYPANNASLGGEIRVTGTADVQDTNTTVTDIYVQIDPSYDGTTFDTNWYTELNSLISGKTVPYSVVDAPAGVDTGKGIKIADDVSKTSWYLTLNSRDEFNGKVNNENRCIGVRAYAISSTGKITVSSVYKFTVDPDAPLFGATTPLRFVQYSDANLTAESASMSFDENVTLKGQWYLVGSVEDESGINEMTLKIDSATPADLVTSTTSGTTVTQTVNSNYVEENAIVSNTGHKNFNIKIPVGNSETNKFGTLEYEISVKDGSNLKTPNKLKFTVAYDNKDPDFEVKTTSALTANGIIRQSNGSYTVTGTFKEPSDGSNNQTGFGRIALYFTRTRNGKLSLLDPTSDDGTNGDANFIDLTATGIVQKEGLYCRIANATLANDKELTVTDASALTNIHAGGLCMVNNVFYRIKKIEDKKVTLDGTLNSFAEAKEVYFALAQVIDNQTQEEGTTKVASGTTGTDDIQYGDGDYMVEGVLLSNGVYNWNVSLDSSNMLDGPVDMTFVAFDKAGNKTTYSVAQKISNNAPRIAGVSFGADNNMDGTIAGDETVTTYQDKFTAAKLETEYDGQNENGTWVTAFNPYEGKSKRFVIKGAAFVKPEIVGGNTGLGWKYTYNKNSTATTTNTTWYTAGHSNTGFVRTDNLTIDLSLLKLLQDEVDEGDQDFVFTILDKTEGGAAEATITLPVTVKLQDTFAPTTKIKPLTAGSVYQGSLVNGHIEVEKDLPDANFKASGSTVYDLDAKISGKVTFEVTAEDNIIVDEIKAQITGYNSGTAFTIAIRNNSGAWTSDNLNASLVGTGAKEWSFELETNGDTFDSDTGKNTVKFKFHFNTEALADVADDDVEIKFIAYDNGSPSLGKDDEDNDIVENANPTPSVPGTVSTGKNSDGSIAKLADGSLDPEKETGYYKVDVVPYITKIDTALNSAYPSVPSVFNRSARGYYPVRRGETITIHGFNLKKGETAPAVTITSAATVTASSKSSLTVTVPNDAVSGELSVSVNGVPSLNNKTSKTVAYNQEPNGVNNNTLTDERKIWVWGSTEVVTDSSIRYPTFRVGSAGDEVFSYDVGGTDTYLYKNGTQYLVGSSFTQWYDTAVAVDGSGNLYGLALNGDCASPGSTDFETCASMYFYPMVPGSIDVWAYTGNSNNGYSNFAEEGAFAWENTSDGETYNPNRIQNPKLITKDGNVYSVYYDATAKRIIFRAGSYSSSFERSNNSYSFEISQGYYRTQSNVTGKYLLIDGQYYPLTLKGTSGYGTYYYYEIGAYSGTAPKNVYTYTRTQTLSDSLKNYSNGSNGSATGYQTIASGTNASAYSAVAVVSNTIAKQNDTSLTSTEDVAVVCWYDSFAKALKISYNTTPLTGGTWSNAVTIDSDFAGWNPDMVVDGEGGIHISYYGASGADLKYAYLKNFKAETADVCTVDSYLSVGTKTSISVSSSKQTLTADDGTSQSMYVPHISYYMSTFASTQNCVKTAWPAVVVAQGEGTEKTYHYSNGVSTDRFTGNWEVQTLPLPETSFPKEYTIGIGEKDSSIILGYATDTGLETTTLYQ